MPFAFSEQLSVFDVTEVFKAYYMQGFDFFRLTILQSAPILSINSTETVRWKRLRARAIPSFRALLILILVALPLLVYGLLTLSRAGGEQMIPPRYHRMPVLRAMSIPESC